MISTHRYDLILKYAALILGILIPLMSDTMADAPGWVLFPAGMILAFLLYLLLFRTLGSYLYCRYTLKMKVSFSQAAALNGALSPFSGVNSKWLPLTEVKGLDDAVKYETALKLYEQWDEVNGRVRKQRVAGFKAKPGKTKALTALLYTLIAIFFMTSIANVPPSSYITDAYCNLFNTDSFYPMLNWCLLALPAFLVFKFIDKGVN